MKNEETSSQIPTAGARAPKNLSNGRYSLRPTRVLAFVRLSTFVSRTSVSLISHVNRKLRSRPKRLPRTTETAKMSAPSMRRFPRELYTSIYTQFSLWLTRQFTREKTQDLLRRSFNRNYEDTLWDRTHIDIRRYAFDT